MQFFAQWERVLGAALPSLSRERNEKEVSLSARGEMSEAGLRNHTEAVTTNFVQGREGQGKPPGENGIWK